MYYLKNKPKETPQNTQQNQTQSLKAVFVWKPVPNNVKQFCLILIFKPF